MVNNLSSQNYLIGAEWKIRESEKKSENPVTEFNTMCHNVIKSNDLSQKDAIEAYMKILDVLGEQLKREDVSKAERDERVEQMFVAADRVSIKDTENKKFLNDSFKLGIMVIAGALFLGAEIIGGNVKELPYLK